MDKKQDVVITYETLFDILRREKSRDELQELPASFFYDLMNYINEKNEFVNKNKENIFNDDEADKANKQMQNIKRIVKEIYNRRERKIIDMTINKAVTGSNLIDTSKLLNEEKKFYESLLGVLVGNRKELIEAIITGTANLQAPIIEPQSTNQEPSESQEDKETSSEIIQNPIIEDSASQTAQIASKTLNTAENTTQKAKELKNNPNSEDNNTKNNTKIKILEDVPQFIGPDLEVLGPFKKDQEHDIDANIADILINSNKAQFI